MKHMLDYLTAHPEKGLLGGEYEAIYGNMPPYGLGKASTLVPIGSETRARTRLGATARASGE
jgi:hypothetical protein